MILAGIDEAGLGPAMGPLTIGGMALAVPEEWDEATPWSAWDTRVTASPKRNDQRLWVGDSKKVYSRRGCEGMESILLNTLCAAGLCCSGTLVDDLFPVLGIEQKGTGLEDLPWYAGESFPLRSANASVHDEAKWSPQICSLQARVLTAPDLNRRFAEGWNKSEVALDTVGSVLHHWLHLDVNDSWRIVVDKQGGRAYYAAFLAHCFPECAVRTIAESAKASTYVLENGAMNATITFRAKADSTAFCVAFASMLAKWLRERLMECLNRYFQQRLPGLRPTAGYHGDAPRFYDEVQTVLAKEGIDRTMIWRDR